MRIIYRYIAKNVIVATASVLVVVAALSFIIGMLRELRNLGDGDYGFLQVVVHELLILPHEVYQFFPMLVLLGGVIALGMLSANHELMVMRAAGVSIGRIMIAVMRAAFILIIIATIAGEILAPRANYFAEKYRSIAQSSGQAVVTMSGIWIHEGNNFIHIDRVIGRHHLEGVTRYEFDSEHRLLAAYFAKSLDFHKGQWVSRDLVKTVMSHDQTESQQFPLAAWDLKLTPNLLNVGLVDSQSMSLKKLAEYSRYLKENRLQSSSFQLAFWQRIFQPLTTIVMVLLAIPFVFAAPRSVSMGRRILFAIIVGFVFYILNAFFGEFSVVFQLPTLLAAILPTALFAAIGFIWMRKAKI